MASSKELSAFILENAAVLELQLTQLDWPVGLDLELFDFELEVEIAGVKFKGRGSDRDSDLAVTKAFVEAVERYVLRLSSWKSSNGLAGHTDRDAARRRARAELLERHIFFEYFLSEKAFGVVDSAVLMDSEQKLSQRLMSSRGVQLHMSELAVADGYFSLATLDGLNAQKPFGVVIGTCFSEQQSSSRESALIEALRYYTFTQSSPDCAPISVENFDRIKLPSLDHHGRLGLDIGYGAWFRETYLKGRSSSASLVDTADIKIDDINSPIASGLLYFARASSQTLRALDLTERSASRKFAAPFR